MPRRYEDARRCPRQSANDGQSTEHVEDGSTKKYTDEDLDKAKKKVRSAETWRNRNSHAYGIIERLAIREASHGRKFGGKFLVEMVRQHDITNDEDGKNVSLGTNDYTAIIARWIRSEHPEIAELVRVRPCALDEIM